MMLTWMPVCHQTPTMAPDQLTVVADLGVVVCVAEFVVASDHL